jgi:hypothetical protein
MSLMSDVSYKDKLLDMYREFIISLTYMTECEMLFHAWVLSCIKFYPFE